MPFNFEDLAKQGGAGPSQSIFTYLTTDNRAAVTSADYFLSGFSTLRESDYIFVRNGSEDYMLRVVSSSKLAVTTGLLQLLAQDLSTGWVLIQDGVRTLASPLNLVANTRTLLAINSTTTIDSYAPPLSTVSDLFDPTTKKIKSLSVGGSYLYRINFTAKPTNANKHIDVDLDIGGSEGVILKRSVTLVKGGGNETIVSMTNAVFTLGTFVANGCDIYIECDGACAIYDISLVIVKLV